MQKSILLTQEIVSGALKGQLVMLSVAAKLTQIDAKIDRFMTPQSPVYVFHDESESI